MPLLLILLCFSLAGATFTISPQILVLKVNSGERVGWTELTHTGKAPVAVELSVHERILDLDGNLIGDSLPKSNDFTVYPSQILLYPGNKVRSQVVLKGKERANTDKAYILYAREVPFDFPKEGAEEKLSIGISITINYQTIIALETNKPGSLKFVSSKALNDGKIELIVENRGSGRVPTDYLYIMAGNRKITEFTGKSSSIMPGQKRRFVFEHDKPLTEREFRYDID
jgi:P pilus assembly chaperone PapD